MENAGLFLMPQADDPRDADLREVDVAIELVSRGAARRVLLVGLRSAASIAPLALAHAQRAGVDFRVDQAGGATRLNVGPSA